MSQAERRGILSDSKITEARCKIKIKYKHIRNEAINFWTCNMHKKENGILVQLLAHHQFKQNQPI